MFTYDEADIKYAVTFGKLDGSSDIDYLYDLNQKEARIYTKARMLGQDLNEVMDTYRIEREIIRFERDEYGSDIRDASVSISFCDNQEQPPAEDIEAYLTDLLKAHKYEIVHEVVEAQINVFEDTENDWEQIALDLAKEVNCPGYAKWKKKPDKQEKKKKKVEVSPCYFHTSWISNLFNPELSEEEKLRRYRGCKNITKPDDYYRELHIITKSGKEVVIKAIPPFELKFYGIGLCPFNTSEWLYRGRKDGYIEGEWGFFNTEGGIVIEPKYRYACGPYGSCNDEYYLVGQCWFGRYAWGVLDAKGNEVLPCKPIKYTDLKPTRYGSKYFEVFIFARFSEKPDDKSSLYGLMKRDETVILEPRFNFISSDNFNWENKLFLAGTSESNFGVFSLEKNEFITPDTCSYVEFNDKAKLIKCRYPEQYSTGDKNYYEAIFDYEGNMINRITVYDYILRV